MRLLLIQRVLQGQPKIIVIDKKEEFIARRGKLFPRLGIVVRADGLVFYLLLFKNILDC